MSPTLDVLLETKKDNLLHLQQLLTEPIYAELQVLYKQAGEKAHADKLLEQFQEHLTLIPHWNVNQVTALKERVLTRMNCDYFPELLKSTFMVFLQLHLATLSQTISSAPIKVKVPSSEAYIHRLLVAVARLVWKKPYLMYEKVRSLEKQKNLLQCESFIHKSIRQTILNGLPLNEIYKYLSKESHILHPTTDANAEEEESSLDSATDPKNEDSVSEEDEESSETETETEEEDTPTASETESETILEATKPAVSESETESETASVKEEESFEMNLVAAPEPEPVAAPTKSIEIVAKEKPSKSLHRPTVVKSHRQRPTDAFF
jgi:hypothetical protein